MALLFTAAAGAASRFPDTLVAFFPFFFANNNDTAFA